jgi:hypothetical protein
MDTVTDSHLWRHCKVVKVEVEAHELKNGEIEKISLVTHGAIQQPFKILKTKEIEPKTNGLKKTLSKVFGTDHTRDQEDAVAALFIRKSVAQKWLPLIRKQGFRVEKEHASIEGDILVLKQEGYTDECNGSVIALNPDVAVQLSSVSKYFDPFPASSSFSDNVAAGSFWPGMHNAMESLAETVWNVLNEAESPDDAAEDVAKQIKAFSSHLNNLVSELPVSVFKMEQESLTKEFEGSNVSGSSDETIVSNEEENMSTVVTKHAPASDLDGLFDEAPAADDKVEKTDIAAAAANAEVVYLDAEGAEVSEKEFDRLTKEEQDKLVLKGGDEGAPKTGGSPGNPVVENTSDTGAVSLDEGGVPAGFRKEERVLKEIVDGKLVEKNAIFFVNDETKEEIFGGFFSKEETKEETPAAEQYTPAEVKLFEALGVMAKSMVDIKDSIEKQNTRIDAVAKTAEMAQETAEETVVLPTAADDLGNAIMSLSGQKPIVKEDAATAATVKKDVFAGLLPGIEGNAA